MQITFINNPSDIQWLFSTHLKNIQTIGKPLTGCQSAVVYGNEDCPDAVELHWDKFPLANAMPAARFVQDDNGNLSEACNA